MYKSNLNDLCQKKGWRTPMYSFLKYGELHNPSFTGSVVVNGVTFVSQSICKSSKSAYNDAAQQALNYFTPLTLSTADMQNTKRQKVSTVSSSGPNSNKAVEEDGSEEDESIGTSEDDGGAAARGKGVRKECGADPDCMKRLARSIERFGEIYERLEGEKQKQMIELEKQRMQLTKDLEIQRMDTQVQLEKIKQAKRTVADDNVNS